MMPNGVLAWIHKIAPSGCTPTEVEDVLKKLDKSIKLGEINGSTSFSNTDNDIGEIYSPPRIAARASRHGLRPGFSLDLTTRSHAGEPWDFNLTRMRFKAVEEFNRHQPEHADSLAYLQCL